MPVIAASAALVIGAAVTLVVTALGPATPSGPLRIYDATTVAPFAGYIGSDADDWKGTPISPDGAGGPSHVKATPGPDGLRVAWNGDAPAQVYLQTANPEGDIDLTPYAENGGALVFDAVLHAPPDNGYTKLSAHCHHPCGAELPATDLFGGLPVGQPRTVKIPLSCFVQAGLDPRKVNTPFLVWAERKLDVTFSNVRVEADAENEAMPCSGLR